jgi:uncharacterized protein YutE (UPF0331/DUF86 family)
MSDAQWLDVEEDISTAVQHFANALVLRQTGQFDSDGIEAYRDRMALMHAMQSAHTSAEAALLRILRILGEEAPSGEDWHQKLISRLMRPVNGDSARPALLLPEVAADLDETRSFRHRVMHSYGKFDVGRSDPSLAAARRLIASLPEAVARFKSIVDPSASG